MDFEAIKKELDSIKALVIDKIKENGESVEEKIKKVNKDFDDRIKKIEETQAKRKMSIPGIEDEKETFCYGKFFKAACTQNWKDAGFENEIITQAKELPGAQKSANAGTGAAGAYFIPEEVSKQVVDLAIAQMPTMEMGPTVLRGLRGELSIPKVTGRHTAYWVGEEEAPTESNATFGEITLRLKTLGAFTKVSKQLLWQSNNIVNQIIRDSLADSMALKLEEALLFGTGTEKQPKGVVNYDGLTSVSAIGTNGGRFAWKHASKMEEALDVANMLKPNGKFGFITRPEVLHRLKRGGIEQFSAQGVEDGQPIIVPIMSNKMIDELLGYKMRTTTLLSATLTKGSATDCTYVIFGDWKQMIIGFFEGFELMSSAFAGDSSGSAMTQRQIWMTAFQSVDENIKDETGFTVLNDARTGV